MDARLNILLVDDDEVDRLAVARALRAAGLDARLEEVDGVSAATTALKGRMFDCVLLDFRLPEGDGLDVLHTIRQAGLDTPVVILTGHGDEHTAVELMKAGAADYLSKHALSPERLAQSLRYATERQALQRERDQLLVREQQAREDAERANAAKDEFLATLSHELRTPLSSIMGWTAMLRSDRLEPGRVTHGLAVIERNARLQAQLINDLLDVSRIVSGKLDLDLRPVDAADVCDAALDTLRPQIETRNITVEKVFDGRRGRVLADAVRLQQVVWNLLTNAIKFSPAEGVIRLEVRRRDATVELAVSDQGCGIAADFLPRVFDRFSQGRADPTSSPSGLGLGLAIVRHIVERHGGTVRVESDGEGRGACFTVTLPAQDDAAGDSQDHQTPAVAPARLRGVRALFVDDNADTRELVEAVLASYGVAVTTCGSTDAALAALQRARPDVLISDIEMPDGDGYQMIRALRLRDADVDAPIPAIALTGSTRAEDRVRILSAGFQLHVPKPVDPSELVAAIASLVPRDAGARTGPRATRGRSRRPSPRRVE